MRSRQRKHNRTIPDQLQNKVSDNCLGKRPIGERENTYPGSKRKLKIVRSKRIIFYRDFDDFIEKCRLTKKILCYPQP